MDAKREHPGKASDVSSLQDPLLGTPLEASWSRYLTDMLLLIFTSAWVGATIWLSFATSRLLPLLVLHSQRTLTLIGFLSSGTVFLLGQLVPRIFEHLRWAFASRRSGIGFDTFLALGGTTDIMCVLKLLWRKSTLFHRFWSSQRLLYPLISISLGSVLLFDMKIVPALVPTTEPQIVRAGYGSFNASAVNKTPDEIVVSLLIRTGSYLIEPDHVAGATPFSCASSDECVSVVLPGVVPSEVNLSTNPTNDTIVYVVDNATGFQLDFYIGVDQSFQPGDCVVSLANTSGLALCVKNVNSSLNFGWSLCPQNLVDDGECAMNLTWSTSPILTTWVSVSSLLTTTTYRQSNASILSVTPKSNSQYFVDIPAEGIRSILGYALTNNSGSVALVELAVRFSNSIEREDEKLRILRGVLALLIVEWGTNPPELGPSSGYFAASGYIISVSPIPRAIFALLSLGVLTWSLLSLLFCWFFASPTPNTSGFPEVDFAAKMAADGILVGLGNATDTEVIKRIQGKGLYVGSIPLDNGVERVAVVTGRGLQPLRYGQPYL